MVIPMIVMVFRAHPPPLRAGRRRARGPSRATRPGAAPTPSSCSSAGCTRACSSRSPTPARSAPTGSSPCRWSPNAEEQERITKAWEDLDIPVELRTVYSPYRELQRPIVKLHRRARRGDRRRLRHRRPARVRARPLVGAGAAQPERAAAPGPAAGPPEHHRHLGAVPPPGRRGRGGRTVDRLTSPSRGVTPHSLAGRARCREPSLQELFP